jgi:hypothetical protein
VKPTPPDHLLGPGQTWVVVEASRWATVSGRSCNAKWRDGDLEPCLEPAVIFDRETVFSNGDVLCERHMGFHRWIDDNGVVMQWKADPPWTYSTWRPKMPPRKR